MIQILLVDDHALVREGFKQLFSLTSDIHVAAEAMDGAQVLQALQSGLQVDTILLDMDMPGLSGADLIARIRALEQAPPVLVLSMHNEPHMVRGALAAGAAGYITKDNNPQELLGAVRKVAAGSRYIDPALAQTMVLDLMLPGGPRPPHESLSEREQQVLKLLAQGLSVNDIAEQLSISSKTVSTHKVRLMEKMGLTSNADLIRYALQHKLS
jgi:DNA-binding NarL/FixJ family response regulator